MTATGWQRFAEQRVIILAAPNGARRGKDDHPALPLLPDELAEDAQRLLAAGASVLHLHVRDADGRHTLDAGRYRDAIAAIRAAVGDELLVQVTTEAVGQYDALQQQALVEELQPEAVSLALRELCAADGDEARFAELCVLMAEEKIWPQFILYSPDDVRRFDSLRARGVLADPAPFALFVLGNYAERRDGTVADLHAMLAASPAEFPWAVCCFGPREHAVAMAALDCGGHVRLGFENNLRLADGSLAPDNAALLQQFSRALDGAGRTPATAGELRRLLGEFRK